MSFYKTPFAAREIGISASRLYNWLRAGKLTPPAKDTSGDFIWTEADIRRARQAVAQKRSRQSEATPCT